MSLHSFVPRDPLIVRDGRPNDGRSESRSLGFPLPSVVAGVVRTALGQCNGKFDPSLIGTLLEHVELRGPVLRGNDGLLVPAPGDAVVMKLDGGTLATRALRPVARDTGAFTSAMDGTLLGLPAADLDKGKPPLDVPSFWRWSALESWLRNPAALDDKGTRGLLSGGVVGLYREERIHVGIGLSFTAEEGKLFGTEGLRGQARTWDPRTEAEKDEDTKAGRVRRFELEVSFDVDVRVTDSKLERSLDGLRPMGGERRLVHWGRAKSAGEWPMPPKWLLEHVGAGDHASVRVILLTPAFVSNSLHPSCFSQSGVEVVAAKVDRPETISGWDLTKGRKGEGAPKRTRRLARAGTVYWLKLSGAPELRREWVKKTWLHNIGDDEQLRRDGFGLAVVGVGSEV